jgi:Fic family protein
VAAASRLAGIRVSDTEVAAILGGEPTTSREAAEIRGYAAALDRGLGGALGLLASEDIRRLHLLMLGMQGDPNEGSPWREEPHHLEAFDSEGKALGRVFQTLPPRLIPQTVNDLTTWLEMGLRGGEQHPLPVIGGFVLAFFAVSPFSRGNRRMSCLLCRELLLRAGYGHLPYASLEREFEEMGEQFYDAFDASETRLWSGEANVEPWLEFFLEALRRHAARVAAKIDLERRALEFTPLQRQIVDTVREHGSARAALLLTATGTNRNTLKDNLRRLVDRGVLEQMGQRRGTFYRLATGEVVRKR